MSAVLDNVATGPPPQDVDVVDLKPILDKLDGLKAVLETFQKVDEEKRVEKLASKEASESKEALSEVSRIPAIPQMTCN